MPRPRSGSSRVACARKTLSGLRRNAGWRNRFLDQHSSTRTQDTNHKVLRVYIGRDLMTNCRVIGRFVHANASSKNDAGAAAKKILVSGCVRTVRFVKPPTQRWVAKRFPARKATTIVLCGLHAPKPTFNAETSYAGGLWKWVCPNQSTRLPMVNKCTDQDAPSCLWTRVCLSAAPAGSVLRTGSLSVPR